MFGARSVGGYLAACPAQGGAEVSAVARGAHLAAIRANGLRVETPDGSVTARLPASDDPRWRCRRRGGEPRSLMDASFRRGGDGGSWGERRTDRFRGVPRSAGDLAASHGRLVSRCGRRAL
ncbi:MAG TPA: 2-dehydropantoate 2-reductase N-terminal domain-containing protein [Acetobacteraceae bacterium]|nr:2-dehydropantoate 2-reductase N-terminal domain-containing protein [Acetobacteraceae bacterium]